MTSFQTLTAIDNATYLQKKEIADFLFQHLDEYGDPHEHIMRCLDYALDQAVDKGGFVVLAREGEEVVGAVVVNKTGMSGYIPENILVYVAVDASQRGKGLGKRLMQMAINLAQGAVALHVEPDNPAKKLYEKLGFTHKYLEMRLTK
ncbi:GNAT family N-acetyltransferase [Lunatimonas salinarum]|uniref:GNAT family N-acetyltransferase n=1 Tax=Lunatimonas salinarum TaxID=1774590 RepID=UPI001AE0C398|nr:GNAT family N-acetyltransferase [Lunatimonas salinarum]